MNYKLSFFNINLKNEGYDVESDSLCCNSSTGKFAEIPKDIDLDNPPQTLIDDKFVVPSDIDEVANYAKYQKAVIESDCPDVVSITICPTLACNYKCEYCFEHSKSNHIMDTELIADTIVYIKNEIDRNQNLKTFGIKWFGGEPLLNISAIEQISEFVIDYCQEHNISYKAFIITNGYYYTKEVSEQLKTFKIKTVQISIDGFAADYARTRQVSKDAYERVLQNIENSVIPVVIRINTTRQNKDIVPTLVKEIAKMPSVKSGFNKIMVARVNDYCTTLNYGFTDEEWIDFRKCYAELQDVIPPISKVTSAKYIPCGNIQKKHAVIGADGFLYRCDNHIGDIKYAIGTVKEGVVENSVDKKYVCSTITEECKKCKMLPICAGGSCRYEELLQGKPCYFEKERFRQNMQMFLKESSAIKKAKKNNSSLLPFKITI